MGLMAWIGQGLAGLAKGIALPFAKLGSPRMRPYVRWTAHVIAVLAILGCLTWLNAVLELDKVVRAPFWYLRATWLPLLFAFIYSLAWVAWWLWRVVTGPAEQSPFPALDSAWREGMHALEQAKIDLLQTPVYLLIGGAQGGCEGVTQATGWKWEVPLTPKRGPVRLCATRDAIFVDLSTASTSGAYASRLLEHAAATAAQARCQLAPPTPDDDSSGGVATMVATRRTAQRGLELIEQSLALLEGDKATHTQPETTLDGIRISEEELETAQAMLAHVCQLVAAERAPFCPINGIITLISWETTATQGTTQRAAVMIDRDLQTVESELGVNAPRMAVITDIDAAIGANALIDRLPPDQRQRRFGVRFPRLAQSDSGLWPQILKDGVVWLTHELLPAMAYRVLKAGINPSTEQDAWRGNVGIFQFLHNVRERESRLLRLLERGMLPTLANASLGGLYFSANAADEPDRQAFLAGAMPQLLEMQNDVAWTKQAIVADRRARRFTWLGYVLLALVIAGLIATAVAVS